MARTYIGIHLNDEDRPTIQVFGSNGTEHLAVEIGDQVRIYGSPVQMARWAGELVKQLEPGPMSGCESTPADVDFLELADRGFYAPR